MFDGQFGNGPYGFWRCHGPSRIVRGDQDEHPGAGGNAFLDFHHVQREVVPLESGDRDGCASAEANRGVVGGEAGARDEDLVAGRTEPQHSEHDGFLGSGRHHDLVGAIVESVPRAEIVRDGLSQFRDPGGSGVVVMVRVESRFCGLHDVRRRVEVRVSAA